MPKTQAEWLEVIKRRREPSNQRLWGIIADMENLVDDNLMGITGQRAKILIQRLTELAEDIDSDIAHAEGEH